MCRVPPQIPAAPEFPSVRSRGRGSAGFTLIEVVLAGCILGVFVTASLVALTQVNRWANAMRLQTLAMAVAQQRVDQVLTTGWQLNGTRPAVLAAGTTTETPIPLNNDTFNSTAGLSSSVTNLDTQVNATRTTLITNLTSTTVRAEITVSYLYRGRTYSVSMTTLRQSDSV